MCGAFNAPGWRCRGLIRRINRAGNVWGPKTRIWEPAGPGRNYLPRDRQFSENLPLNQNVHIRSSRFFAAPFLHRARKNVCNCTPLAHDMTAAT